MDAAVLHDYLDTLQRRLAEVHQRIVNTWFLSATS